MKDYLILKLQGPMQSWGEHSFEGLRPSSFFPTRSAVLGLLGACSGIRRGDQAGQRKLAESLGLAVRIDNRKLSGKKPKTLFHQKLTDYHTIKGARKEYRGLKEHATIQTWREYLSDAEFTIVLWEKENAMPVLDKLAKDFKKPTFTPYLGRRSCPIARPLFEARVLSENEFTSFDQIEPQGGQIFSETPDKTKRCLRMRDVPIIRQPRQFSSRMIYVYGGNHVSE